jgi:hypothetical protein
MVRKRMWSWLKVAALAATISPQFSYPHSRRRRFAGYPRNLHRMSGADHTAERYHPKVDIVFATEHYRLSRAYD